jgi:D-tyrosyl-tRNA(Tyr) deacylase
MTEENNRKALFLFCNDLGRDPVAARIYQKSTELFAMRETGGEVDGLPVVSWKDANGHEFIYVRTAEVVSHDYDHYLPILNEHFADCDFAGLVNWHAGEKAPDKVLTVHTTGDVVSGQYGRTEPAHIRSLLLAIEENRRLAGLNDFTTTTEATHWSGIPYGGSPARIPEFRVPLADIEIGSSPASWSNPTAVEVMARSLPRVFDGAGEQFRSLLCVGGVHLETAFTTAVFSTPTDHRLAISHILPNHWLAPGGYDGEVGAEKLRACVNSIVGGVDAIVFHDNLKSPFKSRLRQLSEELGVPLIKHQRLRTPQELPFW